MNQKQKQILDILLDRYERRGLYNTQTVEKARAVSLNVAREFPEYANAFLVEESASLDSAIEALIACSVLNGVRDARGMYSILRLHIPTVDEAYRLAERTPISSVRQREAVLLHQYESDGGSMLSTFCRAQLERLSQNKALAFGIGDDYIILQLILIALQAIERLEQETYIRNFSEAVFHDSKQFQSIRPKIERILCEYGDRQSEPRQILEQYNLFDNPAYIWVKGSLHISYPTGIIDVAAIPGGLALPSRSLDQIDHIAVNGSKVITVENLTTYHDVEDSDSAIFYLGGFLNQARRHFLQKVYADNRELPFFHKGDLDVYGFLILEHLKASTAIPFKPMEMDLPTLQKCFAAGHCKPLTGQDIKAMMSPVLQPYKDILHFMVKHNCKVEQESLEAMNLFTP